MLYVAHHNGNSSIISNKEVHMKWNKKTTYLNPTYQHYWNKPKRNKKSIDK